MKKCMATLFILALAAAGASAQFRIEVGIDAPLYLGITTLDNPTGGDTIQIPNFLPFPSAQLAYEADLGFLRTYFGVKAYTFIVESIAWPYFGLETDLGPLTLSGSVGGFAFAIFGLYNTFQTGMFFVTDVAVHYRLGQHLRLGVGAMGLMGQSAFSVATPYAVYASAKLTFPL